MNIALYNNVVNFVDNSFGQKHKHFDRTVHWIKQLKPDADEAMLIAAYSHDIQRVYRPKKLFDKIGESDRGFQDKEMMRFHQEDGAKIMTDFLKKEGAEKALIERVSHLISKHEEGGDKDQDLLKDADSISFFKKTRIILCQKKLKSLEKKK